MVQKVGPNDDFSPFFSSLSSGDSGQLSEEGETKPDRNRKAERDQGSRKSSDSGHSSEVRDVLYSGDSAKVIDSPIAVTHPR